MRALVLAPKYFGMGGAETYTRMFAEAVAMNGAKVDVLSFLSGEMPDRTCPGQYLGDQGFRSTAWTKARFLVEAIRRGFGYDLIICSHVALATIGHLIFRFSRVPYVVIGHGIDVWGNLEYRKRQALRQAARVVTVSHFTARMVIDVQGVPNERVTVIHPAVDPVLLAGAFEGPPIPQNDWVTFLTVARLRSNERYKGCDTVISALPSVLEKARSVRYVIVGDGDDRSRLELLAHERGVAAAVTFAGPIDRSSLATYYRTCDVFVMPSVAERRQSGWSGEGFGISYIEAAAFGRPVIAGLGGGAPEAVQDGITGYLVDGQDANAVAGVLVRMSRDKALRERMGAAGQQWVQNHFTFERFRRDAGVVISDIVGGKGRDSDLKPNEADSAGSTKL